MKTLTKLITFVGVFVLIMSWAQWWFRFPDPSQLFMGTLIAIAIFGGAYTYERLTYLTAKLINLEMRLDSLIHPRQ